MTADCSACSITESSRSSTGGCFSTVCPSTDGRPTLKRWRASLGELVNQKRLRQLQGGDRGLASHCREVVQKLNQCLPTFQVVQQSLKRNTCPAEDRRTSENIGVLHDDFVDRQHSHYLTSKHARIVTSL